MSKQLGPLVEWIGKYEQGNILVQTRWYATEYKTVAKHPSLGPEPVFIDAYGMDAESARKGHNIWLTWVLTGKKENGKKVEKKPVEDKPLKKINITLVALTKILAKFSSHKGGAMQTWCNKEKPNEMNWAIPHGRNEGRCLYDVEKGQIIAISSNWLKIFNSITEFVKEFRKTNVQQTTESGGISPHSIY